MPRVGGQAVAQVDHRARPRRPQRSARGEPRLWPAVASHQILGCAGRQLAGRDLFPQEQQARCGAAELAGDPDPIPGLRAVAPHRRLRRGKPAHHGHGDHERARGDHVAPGDSDVPAPGALLQAAHELERVGLAEVRGQRERHDRLARLGPHRREVGERGGERLPADVAGSMGGELEVDPFGDRVHRDHRRPIGA
jgi:hypothetical protein